MNTRKHPILCKHQNCSNKAKKNGLCWKHRSQRIREHNPINYTFLMLKHNAYRRGITFDLTLEYFTQWCAETGYMNVKGRKKENATIDRINRGEGYSAGNLQILSNSENVEKYNTEESIYVELEDDYPF